MAKHNSPIRLEASLVDSAMADGLLMHRSATEQIEQWASLGREVAKMITPAQLLDLYAGLAKVEVVAIPDAQPLDPMAVINTVDSAVFKESVSAELKNLHDTLYRASVTHPGYLEQVNGDKVSVGRFENGHFTPMENL